uniref:Transposase IS66 family protein n=1 Tax=Candidatus Methanophagaceae archaeon ANME-1 ERB6 TaxID=2759912 RepID=A0A7G9YV03_9EURY|nr:hypothetical protein FGALOIDC_00021 [Methanosarcinales archaeon ANME-1 ERB6]
MLKITTDSFPFDLYYVQLYGRYRRVRTTIRRCISEYPYEDAYRGALCKLDAILTSVLVDKRVKTLAKSLKYDRRIFRRLKGILENEDQRSREVVEGRMSRFLSSLERKATTNKKYAPLVKQLKKFWGGLFYTYDHDCIPRTNNDMERFIWELRKKWKRMTGCTRVDEWIAFRAPTGIYMFNLIGCSPPLKELGFSVDLAEMLSSVSYESYRRCMEEYEGQKGDDRIRRRGNHDVEAVLTEIERLNRAVSMRE